MTSEVTLTATEIIDQFAWNTSPLEIDESNFAHMNEDTLKTLKAANSSRLHPFEIEEARISGHKFCGLVVVIDNDLTTGLILARK